MPGKPPRRSFGSTGREVATIGQGTWRAEETGKDAALAALRHGLDLGLTHIDTAEMYGSGEAERIVGAAIQGRRDEVFLVSKVLPEHASKSGTLTACEKSLARLRTDRLDCYLLHWRGAHPLEGTIEAFETLLRDGKILAWGVSNFDVADLAEVLAIAGPGHPSCNQVLLSSAGADHRTRGIAVVPGTRRGGRRLHALRRASRRVRSAHEAGSCLAGHCLRAPRHPEAGGARISAAPPEYLRDSEGLGPLARGTERRGRLTAPERAGTATH